MPIKSEFESVPIATQPFSRIFLDRLWYHFCKNATRYAMINARDENDRITFGELHMFSHAISKFLETRHFGRGDTACAVLSNSWQFFTVLVGIGLQGATLSPASNAFTEYELYHQFLDSHSKLIFCTDANLARVFAAAKQIPQITTIIIVNEEYNIRKPLPVNNTDIELLYYDDVVRSNLKHCQQHKDEQKYVDLKNDLYLLPYSSGTTGSPKGVMLSHCNVATMLSIQDYHFAQHILPYIDEKFDMTKEHSLMLLPLYHIYGLIVTATELYGGMTVVFMRGFDPHLFCSTIQKYRIQILKVVPPVLLFLAKNPLTEKFDLSSVKFIFTGAAPTGRDLCIELIKKYPNLISVAQGYGMTELCLGSLFPDLKNGKHRYETSGKLISNFEMKIVDVKTGKEVAPGESGELCFRSPTIMMGYLNRLEATAEVFDNDGWLKSGDIGILEEDGFVRIVDRYKELIKVKGYQVSPAELEDVLLSNMQIADCAVIGVSDNIYGELPKAYIVRNNESLTENSVHHYVKDRVATYKQLKGGIEFVDKIPKSPSGKILRRFLRDKHEKDKTSKI